MDPIPLVDYAAFMDSKWHDIVLFVSSMLERYTMTELWSTEIVRFTQLILKSEEIHAARMSKKT